jgi:hypothetical protein
MRWIVLALIPLSTVAFLLLALEYVPVWTYKAFYEPLVIETIENYEEKR